VRRSCARRRPPQAISSPTNGLTSGTAGILRGAVIDRAEPCAGPTDRACTLDACAPAHAVSAAAMIVQHAIHKRPAVLRFVISSPGEWLILERTMITRVRQKIVTQTALRAGHRDGSFIRIWRIIRITQIAQSGITVTLAGLGSLGNCRSGCHRCDVEPFYETNKTKTNYGPPEGACSHTARSE
jgi:hypothetical protein